MTRFELRPGPEERNPFFTDLAENFWKEATPELQAAMLAGCEMEYSSKVIDGRFTLTVRTKHPVAVVRHLNRVTVYEQKPSEAR